MTLQLVGGLALLALMIGAVFYIFRSLMRETLHEMDQSTLALIDARRLLEAEEDRDSFILTRARIEPLIAVADVRWDRTMLWFHLTDGQVIGAPLARWPRLQYARRRQRRAWRQIGDGSIIVWDDLDLRVSARVLMGHDP